MKETYAIALSRPGLVDLPELCRTESAEAVAALMLALLSCHDSTIRDVRVTIERIVTQEKAVWAR